MIIQDKVFESAESDNWFKRNQEALKSVNPETDVPLKLMKLYNLKPAKVLEVGAANGYRLSAIRKLYGAEVTALEPSSEAIQDGQTRFPEVEFKRGVASDTGLEETFDLVIVNFVFHWIDRVTLLRSVSEMDRALKDNGHLIVGDFYPSNKVRVPYHHRADHQIYTFKQDYAALFIASGIYNLICLMTSEHSSKELVSDISDNDRVGVWLLRKSLTKNYSEGVPGS